MPIRFDGEAAIVTAAGGGIGRATALLLAARGARVLVNDVDGDAARAVAGEIVAAGGDAVAEGSAVGTGDFAEAITGGALAAFGRIDILVNNAGISRPRPFGEDKDAEIDAVCAVNFMGPYRLMRAAWPHMKAQGGGRIVNTSSSAALGSGMSGAYSPSKAALIGLTKEAAISGERLGIRVNAIMPSASTPLLLNHPEQSFRDWMSRHFPPERVAAVTGYLVATACELNGEILTAGGGLVGRVAFIRSQGYLDPALSPEMVADNLGAILDLAGGEMLSSQKDLQEIYFRAFPRDS
jgi:NAD(P)-dependent dehydrogenase (short-subunit alcohol dehydrogenase family)